MRGSDFLPPIPPRFVSFAWRLPASLRCSLSRGSSSPSASQGVYGSPVRLPLETAGSPRFLGVPLVRSLRSQTPAGPWRLACRRPDTAAAPIDGSGSREVFVSRLHRAAPTLPVYASRPGSPPDRATLGSGWLLAFAVRDSSRWDPLKVLVSYMTSSFSRLGLAHQPVEPLLRVTSINAGAAL